MSQFVAQLVAFKMHMVKRTRHNRTATTDRANRMSIVNGFVYCSIFGYKIIFFVSFRSWVYKLILVSNYGLIMQEKSLFR